MPSIFEFYGWLFEGILWIPIIAILLLVLVGAGYVAFYAVGFVFAVLGFGSPIFVPLFIYLASIYESLWFPWLAAISGIFGLIIWPVVIYTHFEDKSKKRIKPKKTSQKRSQAKRLSAKTSSFSA